MHILDIYWRMRLFLPLLLTTICLHTAQAQSVRKINVLFVGNSYTGTNNMPQIVANMATSTGDTLVWDMETPGGASFLYHVAVEPKNAINKIKTGGWDYVTLQEQSLQPATNNVHIANMFVYGGKLDSFVNLANPCAETVFYMTWGRKNGEPYQCTTYNANYNWPYFCTYHTMDSLIRLRYEMIADSTEATVAPAGAVWRYLRTYNTNIELYMSDESHPSAAGSYAAACAFYTAFFRKDPTLISYDFTLDSADAAAIRFAAKNVIYDSMSYWHIGEHKTNSLFNYSITGNAVSFKQESTNATSHIWHFGDGQTDTSMAPVHTYAQKGTYVIMHVALNNANGCSDTSYAHINLLTTDVGRSITNNNIVTVAPNPNNGVFRLNNLHGGAKVVIYNSVGQQVYLTEVTGSGLTIDLSDKPKGVYMVQVVDREVYRDKIVIQ